jgi:hypothetical protein
VRVGRIRGRLYIITDSSRPSSCETTITIGGLPTNQKLRFATMTVMVGTRQEGAAVAISPVVFPARRWFEFQMSASSWQGTSAVGLDLIAAGVYLLQH